MRVRGITISDSVRKEVGGKDIIIGAYANAIIAGTIPFLLPTFAIRIEVEIDKNHYDVIEAAILTPDKKVLQKFKSANVDFKYREYTAALSFEASPMVFEQAGEYEIQFGMDSPIQKVGTFFVVQSEAPAPPKS